MSDTIFNKVLSRKFVLTLFVVLGNFCMVYFGKISDGVYSTVIVASVGAYLASNVISNRDTTGVAATPINKDTA